LSFAFVSAQLIESNRLQGGETNKEVQKQSGYIVSAPMQSSNQSVDTQQMQRHN